MSCYYCGGQRRGCPECRPKVQESEKLEFKREILGEWIPVEQEAQDFKSAVIDAINNLDANLNPRITYEHARGDVLYTKDNLTLETSEYKLIKLVYTYETAEKIAEHVVGFWKMRRKVHGIMVI